MNTNEMLKVREELLNVNGVYEGSESYTVGYDLEVAALELSSEDVSYIVGSLNVWDAFLDTFDSFRSDLEYRVKQDMKQRLSDAGHTFETDVDDLLDATMEFTFPYDAYKALSYEFEVLVRAEDLAIAGEWEGSRSVGVLTSLTLGEVIDYLDNMKDFVIVGGRDVSVYDETVGQLVTVTLGEDVEVTFGEYDIRFYGYVAV